MTNARFATRRARPGPVRYAVIGLGHIAQAAVLPAFRNAKNSRLCALVSDDSIKLKKLGRKYGVRSLYRYGEIDACFRSGEIDAVYIALPNNLHAEYAVAAARAGIHVLCEKPMAVTSDECATMIRAAREHRIKMMIAYRLHFEGANLAAIDLVRSGKIGEPRIFSSTFGLQAREGGIRLRKELGGGTLYDIGIYCINAARYLFRAEPYEAYAASVEGTDKRFEEVDEATSCVLRFPDGRLATFTCSFGIGDVSEYRIVGTKGDLTVEPAYDYETELNHVWNVGGKKRTRTFKKRDQFGPELHYFSECVLEGRDPEPSGKEGMADVRVIEALLESAETHKPVKIAPVQPERRPTPSQEISRPPVKEPELVHTKPPFEG